MNRWKDIKFKYQEPEHEYYIQEIRKIDELMSEFCAISRVEKSRVRVNVKSLKQVIKRVDMRELYFHVFHENMDANEYKVILGLTIFWILKLRPFWFDLNPEDEDIDEEMLDFASSFNEKFSLHLVITLLNSYNAEFIDKGEDLVKAYCDELEYSFRYRDLSKESLFLMFDPFYYMYFYNASVNKQGNMKL